LSKSVKLRPGYGYFSIFQDGGGHHRGFSKFLIFEDGGRLPAWICSACVETTHEVHLVAFITVQHLVGIDAVALIICTFFDFVSLV